MAKYKGYLLKVKDQIFPMKYIKSETYTSTDNQRSELKAYRNTNNYLIRQTSPNFKTKIEFETPPLLQSQYEEIRQLLNQGTINRTERKVKITYWNSEDLAYKNAVVYMPDMSYTIKNQLGNELIYNPLKLEFIEY